MAADTAMGDAIADTLESVAFGLARCWWRSEYKRRRQKGIIDQEVDKFSLLLINSSERLSKGFQIFPGRRGPGPAVRGASGPVYICDLIELFQKQIIPANRALFLTSGGEGDWRYFEPQLKPIDWDRWKERKGRRNQSIDSQFLEDFSSLIEPLSPDEVIALGRHPSPKWTVESLRFLASSFLKEYSALKSQLRAFLDGRLDEGDRLVFTAERCFRNAQVACEKISKDPEEYRKARLSIARASDTPAKRALLDCRVSPDEIWEDPAVRELIPKANSTNHLARVIWSTFLIWGRDRDHVNLHGRKASEAENELEGALTDWNTDTLGLTLSLPVEDLRKGRLAESLEKLEVVVRQLGIAEPPSPGAAPK
jgi:hypothetical protein